MKCILYIGDFIKGNGPSSVDLSLRKAFNMTKNKFKFEYMQSNDRLTWKILRVFIKSDLIHVSGVSFLGLILMGLGRVVGKNTSMTMHGSLIIESEFRKVYKYRILFEKIQNLFANKIFPVSYLLAKKAKIKKKVSVIPNGFNFIDCKPYNKQLNLITLIGGGRREKRHLDVCEVINEINKRTNLDLKVNMFGEYGLDSDKIRKFKFVMDYGFTSKDIVYASLSKSQIFIQYSAYEPFSLSVGDAINHRCKIITSDCVGINDFIEKTADYQIVRGLFELEKSIYKMLEYRSKYSIKEKLLRWDEVADKYIYNWESILN